MTKVCLFPIPDCVSFPGTIFPLHVFEPRYRKMINYCLDNNALLGICHTRKTISSAKSNQTLEQALKSNQATYQPHDIFSAGLCELIDTTDDGRMYLNVHIQQRYRALDEIQTIPFLIYECEVYADRELGESEHKEACQLKDHLIAELSRLLQKNKSLLASFQQTDWQAISVEKFSNEIFGFLKFPAEFQQQLLTLDSPLERLSLAMKSIKEEI